MTSTFRLRFCFVLLFALMTLATACPAQTPTPAAHTAKATNAAGMIRGHVADPTGALIPGAKVTVATASGAAIATAIADSAGAYQVSGLAAGRYILRSEAQGFSPAASAAFTLLAGQNKNVDLAMAILAEQQSVTVTDDASSTVSVEADSNSSSVVLKDKDLDSLSDDPDELSSELTALAGPAAGPNGGEIYVGGFSGGQLPPKSSIREIRVNQNPYSAEFDHLGYGRIEILTKPGTDQLHGRFFMQGNDDAFNTASPFAKVNGIPVIPAYHSIQYNGNVSGSLSKSASFFFNIDERNNQNASIYTVTQPAQDATGLYYIPKDSKGNPIPTTGSLFNPSTHTDISPRVDIQLGAKHTLTARYEFERFHQSGSIGSMQLPDQSSTSNFIEHTAQLSDSWVINDHIVNETRVQYLRDLSNSTPDSTAPTVSVSGSFTSGGASGQRSIGHSDHIELWNITTMSAGTQAIKFGTRMRWNRQATFSNSNFNGSFSFSSLDSYVALLNGLSTAKKNNTNPDWTQIAKNGGLPIKLTYTTTTSPTAFEASVYDAALFFQDDWKATQFLTLSGGLRWESQNHLSDHSDFAPRVAFAYALDGHKKGTQAKTVLRGGYGFFYDRFGLGNVMNLKRFSGGAGSQTQNVITNPTCFTDTNFSALALSSCGAAAANAKTTIQAAPNYHSPYDGQLSFSIERQLGKSSLTITALRTYGVHQIATRNSNAYKIGSFVYGSTDPKLQGERPNTSLGIVQEYYPEAIYKQNQLIANFNAAVSQNFNFSGYYGLSNTRSNVGTASNSWNIKQDYRRMSWTPHQMLFLMGNYTAPLHLVFNPFLVAQAGRPYSFTSPYDLTGDNFFNSRPALLAKNAPCPANPAGVTPRYAQTSQGCFDMIPDSTESIVAGNTGKSPSSVAFNLRLSRAIGFGRKLDTGNGPQNGSGGAPRGPMGGGFHGGGGGHGMVGLSTGRKYSLSFSAQALNLFNNVNYGTPVGTVNSSYFGQSTNLAGNIFSSGSASRRIFFQSTFSF